MRPNQAWIHNRYDALKRDTKGRDRIGVAFLFEIDVHALNQVWMLHRSSALKRDRKGRDRLRVAFLFKVDTHAPEPSVDSPSF
jgi:hypothetical protein